MKKSYLNLLLILLPLSLYANALPNSFHYDDQHTIVNNPHIRSESLVGGLKKIPVFFTSGQSYSGETHQVNHFRPLLYSTYMFNYAIAGLSPVSFRAVNLILHIGCVIMVYLIAVRLIGTSTGAFLAALIFGIHPLFSEAVNYISARSSLLATFFYLLAFHYFTKFRDSRSVERVQWLTFSLFTFFMILAFLSKEIAITLPFMMIIYDRLWMRTEPRQLSPGYCALPYVPIVLMGIVLVSKINFIKYFTSTYLTTYFINTSFPAIMAQVKGTALLIWLFVFPFGLSIEHGIAPPVSLWDGSLMGSISLLALVLGSAFYIFRSQKAVAFLLFWFLITSIPTTLVPLNIPLLEHRGYLPGIGLAILLGWIMARVIRGEWSVIRISRADSKSHTQRTTHHVLPILLCGLILALYGGVTYHRNTIWKNEVTLWSDAVGKVPYSERAWTNLGLAYLAAQEHKRGLRAFEQGLSLNPKAVQARVGIGSIIHLQGNVDEAVRMYQEAISIYPNYYLAHFNLGVAYQQQNQFEKALASYKEALKNNKYHPQTHLNLGSVYLALGKPDLAIQEYRIALRIDPALADAHSNLAVVYEMKGDAEKAAFHSREAQRLKMRDE